MACHFSNSVIIAFSHGGSHPGDAEETSGQLKSLEQDCQVPVQLRKMLPSPSGMQMYVDSEQMFPVVDGSSNRGT